MHRVKKWIKQEPNLEHLYMPLYFPMEYGVNAGNFNAETSRKFGLIEKVNKLISDQALLRIKSIDFGSRDLGNGTFSEKLTGLHFKTVKAKDDMRSIPVYQVKNGRHFETFVAYVEPPPAQDPPPEQPKRQKQPKIAKPKKPKPANEHSDSDREYRYDKYGDLIWPKCPKNMCVVNNNLGKIEAKSKRKLVPFGTAVDRQAVLGFFTPEKSDVVSDIVKEEVMDWHNLSNELDGDKQFN